MELVLLYKKFAFQQSRLIKDAIMENRKRNIPIAIAMYGVAGEAVGDVKAGIKGTVSGQGPGEAIAARGQESAETLKKLGVPEAEAALIGRIATNLSQAWAIGLLGDALESAERGPSGILDFAAGPVVGGAVDYVWRCARGSTSRW